MKVLALLTLAYVWQHFKGISDILTQQYLIIAFQRVDILFHDESPCHIKKDFSIILDISLWLLLK